MHEGTESRLQGYRGEGLKRRVGSLIVSRRDGSVSSSCCAIVLDHRKPRCFWRFFDDELNLRLAEMHSSVRSSRRSRILFSAGMEKERRQSVQVIT